MKRVLRNRLLAAAWLLVALLTASCGDPIVGAKCAPGYSLCDGVCISTIDDEANCGACGHACGPTALCVAGACTNLDGGPVSDGAVDGATDASLDGATDAALDGASDAAACACTPAQACCSGVCTDLQTDVANCGMCGKPCAAGESCIGGACLPPCGPGLTRCGSICVDTTSDPDHCGNCTTSCATGICASSVCQGATPGHVVLIGHDYQTTRASQSRVLGNSVFLSGKPNPRVLVYVGNGSAAASANVSAAIATVSTSFTRTDTSVASQVPTLLASADTFVVLAQEGTTTDADLAALGAAWASALPSFVQAGGVVVVLDGGTVNAGTWQVLVPAGLLTVTGRTAINLQVVTVVSPADGIAAGVPSSYRAEASSVRYDSTSAPTVIAECPTGVSSCLGPVVVHAVVP